MKSGIYQIINKINGIKYIGSTNNFESRFNNHKRELRNNKHDNLYLQNAWNKYGEKNFYFQIIEFIPNNNLIKVEQDYLNYFIPFNRKEIYNICERSNTILGIKRTEESKKKYSLAKQGNKNPMFGKRGELAPFSKISDSQRLEIYTKYQTRNYIQKDLAREYNISQTQVGKIIKTLVQYLEG